MHFCSRIFNGSACTVVMLVADPPYKEASRDVSKSSSELIYLPQTSFSKAVLNCELRPSGCLFIARCKDTEGDLVFSAFGLICFSPTQLNLISL